MVRLKNAIVFVSWFCFLAGSAFFLPRWLITNLGENHFLSSYIYIYGQGLPFFALGLYALIKSKALQLKIPGEKKWLVCFVLVLVWNMLAHGLWIGGAVLFPSALTH